MFSGRHQIHSTDDGRMFIDRNPLGFNMMIDYIRNSGQLTKEMRTNYDLLDIELNFWGIDKQVFKEKENESF